MPITNLKKYLDEHHVKYTVIHHPPVYTAQNLAEAVHISGDAIAKTVIVRMDGDLAMVVLPATQKINLEVLNDLILAEELEVVDENEFRYRFPDCEIGAMPPFGNLYGMDVYVAESLAQDERIAFPAGSHREVIWMKFDDFERLVRPQILDFAFEYA